MSVCTLTGHTCGTDTVRSGDTCPDRNNGFRCKHLTPHTPKAQAPAGLEAMREAVALRRKRSWTLVQSSFAEIARLQDEAIAREAELATLRASVERMEAALKAAETRFSDIAAGNAFQPRLHAAAGSAEARAALTPEETPDA